MALNTAALNATFEVLTHPHRRYMLYYLRDRDGWVPIETLADALVDWDSGRADPDTFDQIETALHHTHIPKLADAGFLTTSPTMDAVALERTHGIDRFLTDTAEIDGYRRIDASD